MSLPTSANSYLDCFDFLDKAMADAVGARRRMDDYSSANYFRMRCHQARKINREDNAATYPKEHHMHGRSAYDELMVTIVADDSVVWVYAKKTVIPEEDIEGLSGQAALAAPTPQLQLPPPLPNDDLPDESVVQETPTLRRV